MFWKTHKIHFSTYQAGMLQSRAYRALSAFMAQALEPYNLSMPAWAMLGVIYDSGEIRLNELADVLGVKPPVATALVNELSEQGHVERLPYADDQRVTLIALTPAGQTLVREVEKNLRGMLRKYLGDIPLAEVIVYLKVLSKLAAKL